MRARDLQGSIDRLRGLGEAIDRAISESRLRRVQLEEERHSDEVVRELRRLLKEQTRRHAHRK